MISDVQLSALANWLGSLTMILIVVYHVSYFCFDAAALDGFVSLFLFHSNDVCNHELQVIPGLDPFTGSCRRLLWCKML